MRKLILTAVMTFGLAGISAMTSFAGQWQMDHVGWWWQDDDGTWPSSEWRWLDGNKDGIAECYYFMESGYLAVNTVTPDGYSVNADGAWTEQGKVQIKLGAAEHKTDVLNILYENEDSDHYLEEVVEEAADYYDRTKKSEFEFYMNKTYKTEEEANEFLNKLVERLGEELPVKSVAVKSYSVCEVKDGFHISSAKLQLTEWEDPFMQSQL